MLSEDIYDSGTEFWYCKNGCRWKRYGCRMAVRCKMGQEGDGKKSRKGERRERVEAAGEG